MSMKKLSEFTGDKAMEVVADLLPPVFQITGNKDISAIRSKDHKIYEFVMGILKHEPEAMRTIYRVLSDGEELGDTAADAMNAAVSFMADSDLLALFGLRTQK